MKRKWLFIGLLSVLGMSSHAEEGVTFYLSNGSKVSFAFTEHPVVALGGEELTISTNAGSNVSYAYEAVRKVKFESDITTAIPTATASDKAHVLFNISQEAIVATGLQPQERVVLYAVNGTLLQTASAANDGTATLQLSALSGGVYVVRTQGGVSYKFVKH